MSTWSLATDVAIWTLIAGSLAVFGWFLIAVLRLAREVPPGADTGGADGADGADER